MRHPWFGAAVLALVVPVHASHAQTLLKTDGFGSLSGKVTLTGKIPPVVNLVPLMMKQPDAKVCCAPKAKPIELVDPTWIVDPNTKAVQNVMIWVKAPEGTYFEIHPKLKTRKDTVLLDQPHCAFLPRIAAVNPVYFDGKEMIETGQKLIIRNSAIIAHNVRGTCNEAYNDSFNVNMPAGTELMKKFKPQPLPILMQCDFHTWMSAKLFVFDHPYYALTKADGTFEIPFVPAGAEVHVISWHEGTGWVQGKKGTPITIEKGKKHTLNIEFEAK